MFSVSSQELQIIVLSALPFTELRLSIPLAIAMGITPIKSFLLAAIGNFLPIAPLLMFLKPASKLVEKIPFINKIYFKIIEKTRAKGEQVEKYGALGLLLFVGIPLPGTGVYSGAILAFLFGIRFKYSFIALTSGMVLAGIIVTLATAGVKEAAGNLFNLELVLVGLAVLVVIYYFFKKRHKK